MRGRLLLTGLAAMLAATSAGAAERGLHIEIVDGWASPKAWRDFGAPLPAPAAPAAIPRPAAAAPAPAPQTLPGAAWLVQVGAFREEGQARKALAASASGLGLASARPVVQPSGDFFRARFAGFVSGEAARAACARLDAGGLPCMVVPPARL